MGSVPDLIRATTARTAHPRAFVEQRGRALQDSGLLPVNSGKQRVPASSRDLARLLFSLAADRVRRAASITIRISDLQRVQGGATALSAVTSLVEEIWAGDRAARGAVITIDTTEPMIAISRGDRQARFWVPGTVLDMRDADTVRRRIEIPGIVIAAIGADLGFRGCADAA